MCLRFFLWHILLLFDLLKRLNDTSRCGNRWGHDEVDEEIVSESPCPLRRPRSVEVEFG